MKIHLLAVGAFAAALAMPLAVCAQQSQAPGTRAYDRGTPSQAQLQRRWGRRFQNLNLSNDQQQRVQSLINQYSQAHPQGSPRDPAANRELRRQMMGILTSDQQNQFRQMMRQRRAQMQQQYQQGPPQQYQQGPPQQYQQDPPQQYQQGPPQGPPGQPPA